MLAFLVACGRSDDHTIDRTYDPCVPLDLVIHEASSEQRVGVTNAFGLWSLAPLDVPSFSLEVRFEEASPAIHGLYDDETGVVYLNSRISDPEPLAIVMAHELGHAFGLPHIDDRTSLMNRGNVTTPPTAEDQAALVALWGRCR
jgi:hypothetical protein